MKRVGYTHIAKVEDSGGCTGYCKEKVMLNTLFEQQEDRDHDAKERAIAHAYAVLRGEGSGAAHLLPTVRQQALLRIVVDRLGRTRAITVGELAERLKVTPRDVKADVQELRRRFRVRIGSSRDGEAGGYYMITTKQEALDTARPFVSQALAELEIARAILEPHEMAELEGQLRLEAR